MARAAAKGGRRPEPDARRDRQRRSGRRDLSAGEQQLFFSRIRRQAKWVFVLLALVFAGSFVFFGVGSGNSGLSNFFSDVFGSGSSSGAPSISEAQKEISKHPSLAKPYRDLANAYQRAGRTDDAISALDRYTTLRPKDASALGELAGLQLGQASSLQQQVTVIQLQQNEATATSGFGPAPSSKLGKALGTDPIGSAVAAGFGTQLGDVYGRLQTAYTSAVSSYQKLAKLQPEQPLVQFQLGQAADAAGQVPVAVAAYKRFLELDPQNAVAPQVKLRILQLQPGAAKKQAATG